MPTTRFSQDSSWALAPVSATRSSRSSSAASTSRRGASWPIFDQLDFLAGAYLFASVVHVPPLLPTLACLPIVLAGSVGVTAIGWALGL
jgi:hypothetical protein